MSESLLEMYGEGAKDLKNAGRFLSVGRDTLYKLMRDGQLPYALVGGKRLIPVRELKRFLASRNVATPAPAVA